MEPWENEAEKAEFRRVLVQLGVNENQAEVARLAGHGYTNEEIAAFQGKRSASSVKEDVRILLAILNPPKRNRHAMGREARRIVESPGPARDRPVPKIPMPLPDLRVVKKQRPAAKSAGRGRRPEQPPEREAPRA